MMSFTLLLSACALPRSQKYRNAACAATALLEPPYQGWDCYSPARAVGTLWHLGASFPLSIQLGGLRHFASLCADGGAGETGDSGDSSCDLWLCPGLICVCALIAGHCSGPGEIIAQGYCWTSLLPLWAPTSLPHP